MPILISLGAAVHVRLFRDAGVSSCRADLVVSRGALLVAATSGPVEAVVDSFPLSLVLHELATVMPMTVAARINKGARKGVRRAGGIALEWMGCGLGTATLILRTASMPATAVFVVVAGAAPGRRPCRRWKRNALA